MYNITLKYSSLDAESQKQVRDFVDQMAAKMKGPKKTQSSYKKKILAVSTWSEDDVKPIMDSHAFQFP